MNLTLVNGIVIGKGNKSVKTNPVRLEVSLFTSTTVWELKNIIASAVDIEPATIRLERSQSIYITGQIEDKDNQKTLYDLAIQNGDVLTFNTRCVSTVARDVNLVFSDGALTPEFEAVLERMFEIYSTDGRMDRDQCLSFGEATVSQPRKAMHN